MEIFQRNLLRKFIKELITIQIARETYQESAKSFKLPSYLFVCGSISELEEY